MTPRGFRAGSFLTFGLVTAVWTRCSSVSARPYRCRGGAAALVALALVTASGCGADDAPASTATTLIGGESLPPDQSLGSPPTDSLAESAVTIGSLPPGPSVDELVSVSTTDLVIVKPDEHDDVLRAAISQLGGEIHFDSEQLGLYGARFETVSAAALAEIRDELRRRGFDASFDIESNDPTTG